MTKLTVAILGGSFDPPTVGHLTVAAELLNLQHVEEVWLVPCGLRGDKANEASPAHRFEMCRLAVNEVFNGDPRIRVCDIEMEEEAALPTMKLFDRLWERHPDHRFSMVIGLDLLKDLTKWVDSKRLLAEVPFIVYPRYLGEGGEVPCPTAAHVEWVDGAKAATFGSVSSSIVRRRIAEGGLIGGLCPGSVIAYSQAQKLYLN